MLGRACVQYHTWLPPPGWGSSRVWPLQTSQVFWHVTRLTQEDKHRRSICHVTDLLITVKWSCVICFSTCKKFIFPFKCLKWRESFVVLTFYTQVVLPMVHGQGRSQRGVGVPPQKQGKMGRKEKICHNLGRKWEACLCGREGLAIRPCSLEQVMLFGSHPCISVSVWLMANKQCKKNVCSYVSSFY